jgi:hypothetical protein
MKEQYPLAADHKHLAGFVGGDAEATWCQGYGCCEPLDDDVRYDWERSLLPAALLQPPPNRVVLGEGTPPITQAPV